MSAWPFPSFRSAAAAVAALLSLGDVRAADFYVATTGDDAGDGSQAAPFATIGAAIDAADAAIAGGDTDATIHVAAGTFTGAGHVLTNAIAVVGAGADSTVVNGNGGYRVFSLVSSAAALKNLCVSNAAFTAAEDSGAGVYMEAGLVEDCRIASCGDFSQTKAAGGGIYASGGRIRRTTFTGCKVHTRYSGNGGDGAAPHLSNGAVCENSLFTGNAAASCFNWSSTDRRGGVVYLTGSGTALVNCSVVENRLAHASGNNNSNYAGIVQKYGATVVNCVAYKNVPDAAFAGSYGDIFAGGDTSGKNWENFFVNSAWDTTIKADTVSPVAIAENSFADYSNADFSPSTSGPLFDGGSNAGYATYATSATDLAGVARSQGASVDIGCYEVELSSVSLSVVVDSCAVLLGATSTFTATAAGGSGSYLYRWDFGDGSAAQTTTTGAVVHAYAAGLHRASVSVSDDGGATWGATAEPASAIVVAPANLYVDAANATPAFPYDTPATAAASFADAYGCLTNTFPDTLDMAVVDGATIHVAAGTYAGSGYVLAAAIEVAGEGAADTVFDGNGGYRVFSLLDAGASLRDLCVSNAAFGAAEQSGAGVYMTAGLVEDCAIVGCGSFPVDKTSGGGIYASGGRIVRTTFTGCKVHSRWTNVIGYGSALFLSHGAICENSLFTENAAPSCFNFDTTHRRGGVVHLTGDGTALVNCTVVKNRLADAKGDTPNNYAGIVQKSGAKVVNCVAYMNVPDAEYVTSETVYGDVYAASADCFDHSAWDTAITATPSPVAVDETAFRNYASGNFKPRTTSVLVDAGTDWNGYLASGALSETDFAGNARRNGNRLDIGCYEFVDRPTVFIVK